LDQRSQPVTCSEFVTDFRILLSVFILDVKLCAGADRRGMAEEEKKPAKQPYEKPTATQITREQAKLKLMGHAMMGDEQAKELLDILFGQEQEERKQSQGDSDTEHKKSA
jgi:hypothetical protein